VIKSYKKHIFVITVLLLVILSGVAFYFLRGNLDEDRGAKIYFYNASKGRLEAEYRELPLGEQVAAALYELVDGPRSHALARIWPANTQTHELVTAFYIQDGVLVVELSDLYEEMPPTDEILFRSAFTLTMTALPHIESVLFRTSSAEWQESAEEIANNPTIASTQRHSEMFKLFFVDESGEGLITEDYFVADVQHHRRTQHLLETLIELQGTTEGVLPLIPPETKVRRVLIDRGRNSPGIYVVFSAEFHSRFSGTTAQARMMLQSIAHTVLEHNDQQQVFFLIASERRDEFHGVTDFNLGFTRDETVMMGYVEPREEEPHEP